MCNVIFMINILAKQAFGSFPLRLFFNVVVGLDFISLKHVGSFVKKKSNICKLLLYHSCQGDKWREIN